MIQTATFWLVLLATVVAYWLLPPRMRLWFLAAASFGYLISLDPVGVVTLLGWTLAVFYAAPRAMATGRQGPLVLAGIVALILGYLIWQKYLPTYLAMIGQATPGAAIAVPLGISYFSFKLIHYAVETARGNLTDRSLPTFLSYVFLFPIFTAGPIERYDHFRQNIAARPDAAMFATGLTRIAHGLIKVAILAQVFNPSGFGHGVPASAAEVVGQSGIAVWQVWAFVVLSYLYAYFDFSAYSDIAIGASRLFGITIMENFRLPVLAVNIIDFWKRWHMTLAAWCQSYVYMPVLARSRSPYAAVFATFVVMGLWHGATGNWFLWGLYHASGVAAYTAWTRKMRTRPLWRRATTGPARYLGVPATFLFVSGSYAFSTATEGGWQAIRVFAILFGIRV